MSAPRPPTPPSTVAVLTLLYKNIAGRTKEDALKESKKLKEDAYQCISEHADSEVQPFLTGTFESLFNRDTSKNEVQLSDEDEKSYNKLIDDLFKKHEVNKKDQESYRELKLDILKKKYRTLKNTDVVELITEINKINKDREDAIKPGKFVTDQKILDEVTHALENSKIFKNYEAAFAKLFNSLTPAYYAKAKEDGSSTELIDNFIRDIFNRTAKKPVLSVETNVVVVSTAEASSPTLRPR